MPSTLEPDKEDISRVGWWYRACLFSPLVPIPGVDERRTVAEHLHDSVPSTLQFSEALKTRPGRQPTNRGDTFDGGCNGGP